MDDDDEGGFVDDDGGLEDDDKVWLFVFFGFDVLFVYVVGVYE